MGIRSKIVITALCASLALPGAAMASSFRDFTSGVKDLSEAAKDVGLTKDNNEPQSQKQKAAPPKAKKQSSKKTSQPKDDRVRGG